MDQYSPFLRLPVEIQQEIFSYDGINLPAVRLVSKNVEAAVFGIFVDRYFGTVKCFFPNPDRLRHLQSVLSKPEFARKINKIAFCCDPSLNYLRIRPWDAPTHPWRIDNWSEYTTDFAIVEWVKEQQNIYCEPPDTALLSAVFRQLQNVPRAKVSFQLNYVEAETKLKEQSLTILSGLFTNADLPKIHSLRMDGVDWSPEGAKRVLRHSRDTLTEIDLDFVLLCGDRARWSELLETMAGCPKLESVKMNALLSDGFDEFAEFVGEFSEWSAKLTAEGYENVQKALRENIAHGVPCD